MPVMTSRDSSETTCRPADWQSIITFFLLNYAAHAMTIVRYPGESPLATFYFSLTALLMPFSGIVKASISISVGSLRSPNALKQALYAGALVEVVEGKSDSESKHWNIHGRVHLPSGFCFRKVEAKIEFANVDGRSDQLSCSFSRLAAVVAIFQLLFSVFTLVHTNLGNQIQLYGYAAYGFTVVPYAAMSLVNLVANSVTPNYPTLYMIRTPTMADAEAAGGMFDGVIADMATERKTDVCKKYPASMGLLAFVLAILALAAPWAIIYGLTGFRPGGSNGAQQAAIIIWILLGQLAGFINTFWFLEDPTEPGAGWIVLIAMSLFLGGPSLWGFYEVGQMLLAHGNCSGASE